MLYQYWVMLGVGAFIFTIISFSRKGFSDIGKMFCFFASGILWAVFSLGVLSITFRVVDTGVIDAFVYMPVNGEEYLALIPFIFGVIQIILGWFHTIEYFAVEPINDSMRKLDKGF